ncbi:uncharacterized protein LOC108205485 isoform X2 [Daucus carota subsp. sativus]|uniref:uncharacterized protein LOC108205485 isoform X2 n=1 Tax=Daucus carota subsp. sativus TaxID=79200 RepID=UPI0007EFCED4|nr:PREDICTED: abnormal spindle-like microcephaly-associated protein homolog [Daucus carota subsp. sativus]
MEAQEKQMHSQFSSPLPNRTSSIFKDISNFKTPKSTFSKTLTQPSPKHFFTASKQTPKTTTTLRRPRPSLAPPSHSKLAASRRLKAFEIEQSKSARKAQIAKENSLKSLTSSLSAWLNFLFENPRACGCDIARLTGQDEGSEVAASRNGKRDSVENGEVVFDRMWRGPKRVKDEVWCNRDGGETTLFSHSMFSELRESLKEVCSFDDLKDRMGVYLSLGSCKEIFDVMTRVTKNIDSGRIKMKSNCSIVTDVGMKQRAMRVLMCYNPIWLRIGLYIIFGGNTLLPNGDVSSEHEISFLKMVIEKQFFSHAGLAEFYVYNKLVAGLYRPGYFEKLGGIILKRFLLLVLILDRAKCQSSLPINHGIDGLDGGSPLLFTLQSTVKSSQQMIQDFLTSDVMHGEGNLLAHLVIVGFKVFYVQSPLSEYDFRVTNLFEDLQDGVRLCRAVQLLQHDSSILTKLVFSSDTRKKNLTNCGIAFQHLKQVGVALYDEDGTVVVGEDIVNGDKELTLSLLWNVFVHLQAPLLINKFLLSEEIHKIRGVGVEQSNTCTPMDMLLHWIQAICENYNCKVDNFASIVDGRAMWCLMDYYFHSDNHLPCSFKISKDMHGEDNGTVAEASLMSTANYTDAVHNFLMSQKLTTLLGKFPEVLQVSDLLEHNGVCNDRSVIILLVFLSFQLVVKRNTDQLNFHKLLGYNSASAGRKHHNSGRSTQSEAIEKVEYHDTTHNFKAIMAWWREMAESNEKCNLRPASPTVECFSAARPITKTPSEIPSISCIEHEGIGLQEKAATSIQLSWKSFVSRNNFRRQHSAAIIIQRYYRGWVLRRGFLNQKHAAITIQSMLRCIKCCRDFQCYKIATKSAIIIQSVLRGWIARRQASRRRYRILMIQGHWRAWLAQKKISNSRKVAATQIQRCVRGWIARKRLVGSSSLYKTASYGYISKIGRHDFQSRELKIVLHSILKLQLWWRHNLLAKARINSVVTIQAHVRGWIVRQEATRKRQCIVLIQSCLRGWLGRKKFFCSHRTDAAVKIQSLVRGWIFRKRLLRDSLCKTVPETYTSETKSCFRSPETKKVVRCVLKIQKWWKGILLLRARKKSILIVQAYVRGWLVRQETTRKRRCTVIIQSHWKGYLARKDSKGRLLDLRLRMQKSAANVDNSMRILNRLIAALSELLTMKSVSGILHTCETLDMTTRYSQKCCEELVAAGAIDTLLKLISSVSRSIPDQEVLRHSLSTLRNLARYPHLTEVLINTRGAVKTILWEFLRNKEEGYFIASELLEKICLNGRGIESLLQQPVLLKRLRNLVDDLQRRADNEKRNPRSLAGREHNQRRLKVATELLRLIASG